MPLTATEMNRPVRPRRAWVVFLFSLLLAGFGQFHAGHGRRGLAWWGVVTLAGLLVTFAFRVVWPTPLLYALGIVPVLLLQLLNACDAARTLRRDQRTRTERPLPRLWSYPAFIVALMALNLGVYVVAPLEGSVEAFSIPSRSGMPTLLPGDHLMAAMAPAHRARLRRGELAHDGFCLTADGVYADAAAGGDVVVGAAKAEIASRPGNLPSHLGVAQDIQFPGNFLIIPVHRSILRAQIWHSIKDVSRVRSFLHFIRANSAAPASAPAPWRWTRLFRSDSRRA